MSYSAGLRNRGYNEEQIHILRRANELRNQPKVDEGEEIVWTAYANTPEIDYKDPLVQLLMLTNTLLQVEFLIEPN